MKTVAATLLFMVASVPMTFAQSGTPATGQSDSTAGSSSSTDTTASQTGTTKHHRSRKHKNHKMKGSTGTPSTTGADSPKQ